MNVTVENLAPCKKLIRIEVEAQKVDETFDDITKGFQREARLPGFRPGKAPKEMVIKRYEAEIKDEAKRKLISESYRKALADQKIVPVLNPEIEETQFGKGQSLQFVATVETAPEFELPEYKGLAAQRDTSTVTTEDIEKAINLLRDRQAKFNTIPREVQLGDYVIVNYTGTCEGKPLTEIAPTAQGLTKKENFWIHVDKNTFIPGFADQLVGLKAADKKTITVDFPADFVQPLLAGKKGVYEVELVEVKERVLPELNDEFAKSYDAENIERLREGVRADLQNELNSKQSRSLRDQVVTGLMAKVKMDLPETMVEQETRNIVYNIVHENQQRGVSKEMIETEKEKIYASAKQTSLERVKAHFVFSKIAEKEGTRVEQMEIAGRLQAMAAQYKMPVDKLIKELEKNDGINEIYRQMVQEKVVELLVQNAKVEDVAPAAKA